MKYISLIDELNLEISTISNIDTTQIIRLQKQIKAKAVLENTTNHGELYSLIENLKNEDIREGHIFIENNLWLKQILLEKFDEIRISSFKLNDPREDINDSLKKFIHPFLVDLIKPVLTSLLNRGEYTIFYRILQQQQYFSEEIKQQIINFLRSKLNFATVYLNDGRLTQKQQPVSFLTNHNFISSLNVFPNAFVDEIQEVNSEIVDIYNKYRKKISHTEFIYAAKVMTVFGKLDIANVFLRDLLYENSQTAKEYVYSSGKISSSSGGSGIWALMVFGFIILRVIFSSSNSNSSSNYGNEDYRKIIQEIVDKRELQDEKTITVIKKESKKKSDHIRFIYSLKLKVHKESVSEDSPTVNFTAFSNPYPKTFNNITVSKINLDNNFTNIKNKTGKDLIIFKLTTGEDSSIIIQKNNSVAIDIIKGDSLLFYTGNNFAVTKFSHFKRDYELSELYEIDDLLSSKSKTIEIVPLSKETLGKNKTIWNESIKTENIELKKLNIDSIYTDYYRRKFRDSN